MPALTVQEYAKREAAERAAYDAQADAAIRAGCCPSVSVVDFGEPTQHIVYCEEHVTPGFTHPGPHRGLAGVDVWERPYDWQWW